MIYELLEKQDVGKDNDIVGKSYRLMYSELIFQCRKRAAEIEFFSLNGLEWLGKLMSAAVIC